MPINEHIEVNALAKSLAAAMTPHSNAVAGVSDPGHG